MGLRLAEALALQVGDIDGERKQVHIRRGSGKGHKDRFVPLPELTYRALRALWRRHITPGGYSPMLWGRPSVSAVPPPTWTEAGLKRP